MDAHRHPDPQRGAAQPRPSYPHPSKEEVRAYMERRKRTRQPPPAPAEIRRQLGWYSGARIGTASAAAGAAAWSWVLPALLTELAAATVLAWCAAFVPRTVLAEINDKRIT
jgi:hypothetical protein